MEEPEASAYFGPKFSIAGFVLGGREFTPIGSDEPDVPRFDV
jgi:hypothetical protein